MHAWHLVTYMAGDNDLEGAALEDVLEMEAAGPLARVAVTFQLDRSVAHDGGFGNWRNGRRYRLRQGAPVADGIASELVEKLGDVNSGDPEVVTRFVDFALADRPADRVALILWSHGTGVIVPEAYRHGGAAAPAPSRAVTRARATALFGTSLAAALGRDDARRSVLLDDGSMDALDTIELRGVVRHARDKLGRPLDLVGMDACLMCMIELAWELRDDARVLVGSQLEEPGDGWPWDVILRRLDDAPDVDGAGLGAVIVAAYREHFADLKPAVAQSAIRLDALTPLKDAWAAVCAALLAGGPAARDARRLALFQARKKAVPFHDGLYVDLRALAKALAATPDQPALTAAAKAVVKLLAPGGIVASHARLRGRTPSNGLAIYFPLTRAPSDDYGRLSFPIETGWLKVLDAMGAT
jgi:hypothetical protein